ncbi:pyridoxal phosphate-dependent decarboxylase family protein [Pseudalkalibacillus salsuginis]|uniref:pyridoxal phosphate-dependent decarboxylase family protein n=1 Tax=Pseudalkalibacillus salsuginis TaxID=2910972 RepID=UPI001F2140E8|nr:aspartate aminotransferase family protein [Pseudalkalibacillus salsuginis]MCF6409371.1 aspartate aminotransferase family protein [Pseudalkalibacillus salsuginis]
MITKVLKPSSIQNEEKKTFDPFFLHGGAEGAAAYSHAVQLVSEKLIEAFSDQSKPYVGKAPEDIRHEIQRLELVKENGESLYELLEDIQEPLLKSNINISNPKSIAHLHCPPLLPGLAAEMIISAFNQSMDSWDQSTAATYLEHELIRWLLPKFGFGEVGDGTFTSGGTQSNYMGLLLARDDYCWKRWGHHVQKEGLPEQANRLRILCSEHAHFTVKKSASQLGLGENAVVVIKTDDYHQMCMDDLEEKLGSLEDNGLLPFALVATCGTTDFGSIDPMKEIGQVAEQYGLWFHVDAAYGGALILSHSHYQKLAGIEQADSITVDFHKLFYQPISCGAFLVKDKRSFRYIQHYADYLNPNDDEEDGMLHLVTKSTQTTRRFDALKLMMSLRMIGTKTFGDMIDYTFNLARETADEIHRRPGFRIINRNPALNAVVFRYDPIAGEGLDLNLLNKKIQQMLLESGGAIMAKTSVEGETYLKFTLLNPRTTLDDIKEILTMIEQYGQTYSTEWGMNH